MANSAKQIGEAAKKLLNVIGDTDYKLADKVFEYNNTAVILLKVRVSGSGVLKILATSFDSKDDCLSDINMIDCKDVAKAENYVESRMPCYDMAKITEECKGNVTYALRDKVIFFTGENEKQRDKTADLNEIAVKKAVEIFNAAKEKGIQIRKMNIGGVDFIAVDKKIADNYLGSSRYSVYSYLSCVDLIYSRKERGKTRYSYRDRSKNDSGGKDIEYFAASAEKLEALTKGGGALPAIKKCR